MNNGWICIHRGISDHWLWREDKPFDKRSAWIDLLLLANHTDLKVLYKGKLVDRKRGEVNLSMVQLADRWGWDRRKVKRYLSLLESDGMVSIDSTRDGTTITLENYDKYQGVSVADGTTSGTTEGTTNGTGISTTVGTTHGTTHGTHDNNDNNYNNDKQKRERVRFTPPSLSEVEEYIQDKGYHVDAEAFIGFYESKNWMVGKNKMSSWKGSIATWERRWKEEHGNDNGAGGSQRRGMGEGVSGAEKPLGKVKPPPIYFDLD